MQGAFYPGAVIRVELTDRCRDRFDIFVGDLMVAQHRFALNETRLGQPPQVHYDFQQIVTVVQFPHFIRDMLRQDIQQQIQIICYFLMFQYIFFQRYPVIAHHNIETGAINYFIRFLLILSPDKPGCPHPIIVHSH